MTVRRAPDGRGAVPRGACDGWMVHKLAPHAFKSDYGHGGDGGQAPLIPDDPLHYAQRSWRSAGKILAVGLIAWWLPVAAVALLAAFLVASNQPGTVQRTRSPCRGPCAGRLAIIDVMLRASRHWLVDEALRDYLLAPYVFSYRSGCSDFHTGYWKRSERFGNCPATVVTCLCCTPMCVSSLPRCPSPSVPTTAFLVTEAQVRAFLRRHCKTVGSAYARSNLAPATYEGSWSDASRPVWAARVRAALAASGGRRVGWWQMSQCAI
ncbi:hypothetical protein SAMN05421811_103468 [Nonomuraea wenchangensis]|uniref:Uncharacterized protein n=1 Tax=Nonomuraea wenchangensis TaxID=568860 RepID=A0A1I0FHR8_9ACTN|nr:hypothetical protein SAMN05421811_103468 [Nonomuraea wenchangensis]